MQDCNRSFVQAICLFQNVLHLQALVLHKQGVAHEQLSAAAACLSSACSFAVSEASNFALLVGYVA